MLDLIILYVIASHALARDIVAPALARDIGAPPL